MEERGGDEKEIVNYLLRVGTFHVKVLELEDGRRDWGGEGRRVGTW